MYGADIIGVDISAEQIEQARVLSSEFGNIAYRVCAAENIDFPENSFDAVTACQCFWYFDPQLVVPLINKIIKPGGTFLKMYMSWSEDDPIAEISQRLVKKYNPAWSSGAPAMEDLKKHHFGNPQTEKFYTDLTFSRDSWHGRIKACRGVLASMDNETFENFEAEHLRGLTALPEQFTVRHEIFLTWYNIEKSEFCPVRTSV